MKKITSLLLALLMLMGMMAVPTMAATDEVSVYLFGEKLEFDVPAQIVNGRTLVPVRKIFEELGYKVDWDNDTRTAIAVSEERTIRITENSYTMYVNDETKTLDVPAQIIGGRTMVPARAISEASGYKVDWDGNTRSVLITQPTAIESPYDELKEQIVREGYYSEKDKAYSLEIPYEDGAVALAYMSSQGTILIGYVTTNAYDQYCTVSIILSSDEVPGIAFDYIFDATTKGVMYGKYSTPGEPYEVFSTNLSGESLENAKDITDSAIANYLDVALYDFSGFKLADFGITY